MSDKDRLQETADQLLHGREVPPVTVREFLSWYGFQRRSHWNVYFIRRRLEDAGLQTVPDFESAYLDSLVDFVLAAEPVEEETTGDQEIADPSATPSTAAPSSLTSTPGYADPTYRISKLAAANRTPISVVPDATVQQAVTIMLLNDFSQLPVMTNERDVKGVISWTSIGTRVVLEKNGPYVREFMDNHQEIRSDLSLFQAIPIIIQYQYVLIRGSDNRITGIVTSTDLSFQFQQLTEPFLLLSEIENHIRRILENKFTPDEFASVRDPKDGDREIGGVADLTFGEYVRLLEKDDNWKKVNIPIDRVTFCKQLDQVRGIRNDVMHFDPDGIPQDDLAQLRDFGQFLRRLHAIGVS